MIQKFFLLYLFGIATFLINRTAAREAIRNGFPALLTEFPYQAQLRTPFERPKCGAGIISDKFVLTAAHCVFKNGHIDKQPWLIIVGTNDLNRYVDSTDTIRVKKIFVLKTYKRIVGDGDDIAVLMLNHRLKLSSQVKKLELPQHKDKHYNDELGVIAGFGWDKVEINTNKVVHGTYTDSQQRFAIARILENCSHANIKHYDPKKHLCAAVVQHDKSKPRGTCHGDSGGPLVIGQTVIGILSTGPEDCNEIGSGSIYTRVSHFLDFIHHAVNDKHHNDIITANLLD